MQSACFLLLPRIYLFPSREVSRIGETTISSHLCAVHIHPFIMQMSTCGVTTPPQHSFPSTNLFLSACFNEQSALLSLDLSAELLFLYR